MSIVVVRLRLKQKQVATQRTTNSRNVDSNAHHDSQKTTRNRFLPLLLHPSSLSVAFAMAKGFPKFMKATDVEQLERYRRQTEAGTFDLKQGELLWRNRQKEFESSGYVFRPRYRAGWKPSWIEHGLRPLFCEDSLVQRVRVT